jgi:hypothetical protein
MGIRNHAMPRIDQNVLDSVFFLYCTKEDADRGINAAATGFIVAVNADLFHDTPSYYGITNWHSAVRDGASNIRLRLSDGSFETVELGPEDWTFIPGEDDVAVVELELEQGRHRVRSIHETLFLTSPEDARFSIGVGEDVMMLGLFVAHDGHATGVPKARFGNISMMSTPDAPIEQPTGYSGENYIIDMHSRDGFSGSPVFVYRTIGGDLTNPRSGSLDLSSIESYNMGFGFPGTLRLHDGILWRFLGIHWGQFDEPLEVLERAEISKQGKTYVKARSGMTCVIPSWRIRRVLDLPKFVEARAALNP